MASKERTDVTFSGKELSGGYYDYDYDGYNDYLEELKYAMEAEQRAASAAIEAAQQALDKQKTQVDRNTTEARREVYTGNRVSAQVNNEALAAMGLGGAPYDKAASGYAESSRIAQDVGLQNSLNALDAQKLSQFNDIESRKNELKLTGETTLAQIEGKYLLEMAKEKQRIMELQAEQERYLKEIEASIKKAETDAAAKVTIAEMQDALERDKLASKTSGSSASSSSGSGGGGMSSSSASGIKAGDYGAQRQYVSDAAAKGEDPVAAAQKLADSLNLSWSARNSLISYAKEIEAAAKKSTAGASQNSNAVSDIYREWVISKKSGTVFYNENAARINALTSAQREQIRQLLLG